MDSAQPSILKRAVAVLVLLVVAAIAIRLAVGFVTGLITAVFWVAVVVALVVGFFWARSTLRSAKRGRRVKRSSAAEVSAAPAPAEDLVAAEMRRISEQLREQGRR